MKADEEVGEENAGEKEASFSTEEGKTVGFFMEQFNTGIIRKDYLKFLIIVVCIRWKLDGMKIRKHAEVVAKLL